MIAGSLNFCLFIHFYRESWFNAFKKFKDSLFSLTKILTNNKKTKVKRDAVLQNNHFHEDPKALDVY
jgi:hypothetical protein